MLWAALRCDEWLLRHGLYPVEVQKLQLTIIRKILFNFLLGLGGLLTGVGVLDLQDAAHVVVGVRSLAGVVGVGGFADWGRGRSRMAPPLVRK